MNSTIPTSTAERVVLLDDTGQHVGTAAKSEVHHSETPLHLAFSCYIFDPTGRLLVTRRALEKRTWPGVWTNSCCGHPAPDEAHDEAVHRRVRQELGVQLEQLRLRLPEFRYRAVDVTGTVENEICPVYTAVTTDQARPDRTEVVDFRWVSWPGFVALTTDNPWAVSPWAAEQVPRLASALDSEPDPEQDR